LGWKNLVFLSRPYRALKREGGMHVPPSCGGYAALAWGYDY